MYETKWHDALEGKKKSLVFTEELSEVLSTWQCSSHK